MKIIFFVPYPTEGASNRFRVEQYTPHLKTEGIIYRIRPFMSRGFYKTIYLKGYYFLKILYFIASTVNRFFDLILTLKYDVIFIHREVFPVGPPLFEYILSKLRKPIIYDFDDAIFLSSTSRSNNFIERLKRPDKVSKIIKISNHIIAGNRYLADFAMRYNNNVTIIPTSIDTDVYYPKENQPKYDKFVIGWIGSNTTVEFLNLLQGVFKKLTIKYPDIEFKIIGGEFHIPGLNNIKNQVWSLDSEIEDLQSFDVGIMPMPDNAWTRGKCGFKAILYMSLGIPCLCSPVGVNKEIIKGGMNGFLADSDKEWVEKLSLLIDDPDLRQRIGMAGRKTVEERYSVKVNAPKFLEVLKREYGHEN